MAVAVVLAGGFGTRIRERHPDLPKPLIPVAGRPFLHWVLAHLARQGVTRVVISTGYKGEAIEAWAAGDPVPGVALACAREDAPLGTAGGFLRAVEVLDQMAPREPVVLVANGDSLVVADLRVLLASAADSRNVGAILGIPVPDASRFGVLDVDAAGRLLRFGDGRSGAGLINGGVYALGRRALAAFPERRPLAFERDVFPGLIERGERLAVVSSDAPFIDIGVPASLDLAAAFVTRHLPPD